MDNQDNDQVSSVESVRDDASKSSNIKRGYKWGAVGFGLAIFGVFQLFLHFSAPRRRSGLGYLVPALICTCAAFVFSLVGIAKKRQLIASLIGLIVSIILVLVSIGLIYNSSTAL